MHQHPPVLLCNLRDPLRDQWLFLGTIRPTRDILMAYVSFSHYAKAPLVVVVLQEDPLDHFEFDFLVVLVPLIYLPVVLLMVPLVLVHLQVYFHFPSVEHALERMAP